MIEMLEPEEVDVSNAIKMLCDQLENGGYSSSKAVASIILDVRSGALKDVLTTEEVLLVEHAYRRYRRDKFNENVIKAVLDKDFDEKGSERLLKKFPGA